eukprot:SAG25_NODE_3648_length_1013_cov_1.141138_2_plen_117_part_01
MLSNGNVRSWFDLQRNLQYTGADGLMVGEALLANRECVAQSACAAAPSEFCASNAAQSLRAAALFAEASRDETGDKVDAQMGTGSERERRGGKGSMSPGRLAAEYLALARRWPPGLG